MSSKLSLLLMLIGVTMTVVSLLITNAFIMRNDSKIKDLQRKADTKEKLIMELWDSKKTLDNKKDNALLISLMVERGISKVNEENVRKYFSDLAEIKVGKQDIKELLKLSEDKVFEGRKEIIGRINDEYAEKLDVEGKISDLNNNNSVLRTIALCFQVLGIIFVLGKDIA